jgi:hypothetical protein
MKDDVIGAGDLDAKARLVDGGVLAKRGKGKEDAALRVRPAPTGQIDVGDPGGRRCISADVIEELVESGQANAAPGEQAQEEDGVQALPEAPAHGKQFS